MMGTPLVIPTALDNMDSSNRFIKALSSLQIAPGVHAHSIVPVKGSGPVDDGDDGVVRYKSAHIDGIESELFVRFGALDAGQVGADFARQPERITGLCRQSVAGIIT